MAIYSVLNQEILSNLCAVVADTANGLTGSQIGKFLASSNILDTSPGITKRDRLFQALQSKQIQDGCSNNVFAFLTKAMNPVNYTKDPVIFETRRKEINQVLLFAGYELTQDGDIKIVSRATNLDEAERRSDKLSSELRNRKVHNEVLKYCKPELLQKNIFIQF